jgi:hypothetical protein
VPAAAIASIRRPSERSRSPKTAPRCPRISPISNACNCTQAGRGVSLRGDALRWWCARTGCVSTSSFTMRCSKPRSSRTAQTATSRLPAGTGRIECTMVGGAAARRRAFGAGGRSLANAAKRLLGIEVPKDLQRSDWEAPHRRQAACLCCQ